MNVGVMKKKAKPQGIPLERILLGKDFKRQFEMLMRYPTGVDPALKEAILNELITRAATNVRGIDAHRYYAKKGGIARARTRKAANKQRNEEIKKDAEVLFAAGIEKYQIASKLARRHSMSATNIRIILNEQGFLLSIRSYKKKRK